MLPYRIHLRRHVLRKALDVRIPPDPCQFEEYKLLSTLVKAILASRPAGMHTVFFDSAGSPFDIMDNVGGNHFPGTSGMGCPGKESERGLRVTHGDEVHLTVPMKVHG